MGSEPVFDGCDLDRDLVAYGELVVSGRDTAMARGAGPRALGSEKRATPREPKAAGAAWTDERGTSEEGRRRSEGGWGGGRGPEASEKIEHRWPFGGIAARPGANGAR